MSETDYSSNGFPLSARHGIDFANSELCLKLDRNVSCIKFDLT